MIVATLPLWLSMMDTTIVNVAYSRLQVSLDATIDEISWASTAYTLASITVLPLTGYLVASYGRRRFFLFTLVMFGIGSMLCGLSTSAWELSLFRFMQGIGGGLLATLSQSILIDAYPDENRADAIQFLSISSIVAPIVGPIAGGAILETFGWQMLFYFNVPLTLLTIWLASRCRLDQSVPQKAPPFSPVTIALLALTIVPLQYVLQSGQRLDWFDDSSIRLAAVVAVVAGCALVRNQYATERPMIDFRCFANPQYAIGTVLGGLATASNYAVAFIGPLFLQQILGFSPLQASFMIFPGAIAMFLGNRVSDALSRRYSTAVVIVIGLLGFAGAQWYTGYYGNANSFDSIEVIRIVQGLSVGLFFVPIGVYTLRTIGKDRIDSAGGLVSLVRQISGMAGIAAMSTLIERGHDQYAQLLSNSIPRWTTAAQAPYLSAQAAVPRILHEADVLAYDHAFAVFALVMGAGAIAVGLLSLSSRSLRSLGLYVRRESAEAMPIHG